MTGNSSMNISNTGFRENIMNRIYLYKLKSGSMLVLILVAFLVTGCEFGPQKTESGQLFFKTPGDAVNAVIQATGENDTNALVEIFGPEHRAAIDTADKAAASVRRMKFHDIATRESYRLEKHGAKMVQIIVGKNEWPFPIPLVKDKKGWRFDTAAGIDEVINRRIGYNELAAIEACYAYVDAQVKYADMDWDDDGVLEYAQKYISSPGAKDGLYWEAAGNEPDISPLSKFVEDAGDYLDVTQESPSPYKGYNYRILTAQGPAAKGGEYDYLINGNMIAGFALVAYPAAYGVTGITTFIVNQGGAIYQKDLGRNTAQVVASLTTFNPDESWQMVRRDTGEIMKAADAPGALPKEQAAPADMPEPTQNNEEKTEQAETIQPAK